MLRRSSLAVVLVLLVTACNNDRANPFTAATFTRPPSADAVLLFVSGSWAEQTGQPRELFALNPDGSTPERLTNCTQSSTPCDFLEVAPSLDRGRVAAVRSTSGAEAGTSALYFMDLARSVETLVVQRRFVGDVDWSPDGFFLVYSSALENGGREDLFYATPDGTTDNNLTQTTDVRERSPRIDPLSTTAVYERIDQSGVGRIFLYGGQAPITAGPETGPALPDTPYVVGADASPVFSPDATSVAFRRLTGIGNGGLGTWDLLTVRVDGTNLQTVATGPVFRGAPDWSAEGIVFVETDSAAGESRLVVVQPDGSGRTVLRTENAGFRMAAPRWLRGS
jgi:hypothetical protein